MNPKITETDFGVYVMVDDTHLSRWVEQDRRLDHARGYIEKFRRFIPDGGTVIDCGTSIGDHTLTYAQLVGPSGKIVGFEANPDVAECCALNMKSFPWVTIYNEGLSDDFGHISIDINPNVGASHLSKEAKGPDVKLVPMDSHIDEFTRVDYIKVDVEGFEPRLLDGARAIIAKFRPAIVMEVNSGALERQGFKSDHIYRRLINMGYRWSVADGQMGSPQYDILATPKK